jgi:ribokinase
MVQVCVVGSLNMDLVVRAARLPRIGETISGGVFSTSPGGKGANQSVAAARLRAGVAMVGRVGSDSFGQQLIDGLEREGIEVSNIQIDPDAPTGVASIGVDEKGSNMIMVASGANSRITPADVDRARTTIERAGVVLLQLEIPIDAVVQAAKIASKRGILVCLDPAPAVNLPDDLCSYVDVINPNEGEAQALTGVEIRSIADAERSAHELRRRGPRAVVVKMGERGALYVGPDGSQHVPAIVTSVVDTTAAGDAFAAGLGVALGEGLLLRDAVVFANRVAGLKVSRMGAQLAMPTRAEVEKHLHDELSTK